MTFRTRQLPIGRVTLASLAALAAASLAPSTAPAAPPATQPWSPGPLELVLPLDVQRLLEVPANDAEDLLEAWAFVIEQRRADADVTRRSAAMENLIDAVVAGGRADALPRRTLARATLDAEDGGIANDPDWTLGTVAERADVVRFVRRTGTQISAEGRAEEGAKWVRAAALLGSQLGLRRGPEELLTIIRSTRRYAEIAQLRPDQAAKLTAWTKAVIAATERFDAKDVAAMRAIDALMAQPADQPLPAPAVAATLDALRAMRAASEPARLWHAYESIALARVARDLIHARADDAAKRQIDGLLNEWRVADVPEVGRWIDEALRPPRPPRTTPLIEEIARDDPRWRLLGR